jgi:hypothetical protein
MKIDTGHHCAFTAKNAHAAGSKLVVNSDTTKKSTYHMIGCVRQAHGAWSGRDPRRSRLRAYK